MRPTVTMALAGLTIAAGAVGTATVAVAAPEVAHGTYLARDGVTDDGTRVAESAPLTDSPLGTCYDLRTPDGAPAAWASTVNDTDRLAQVSERSCAEQDAAGAPAPMLLAPGQPAPPHAGRRSVRFSGMS